MSSRRAAILTGRRTGLAAAATAALLALPLAPLAADPASPVGLWRTIDDRTGRERGLVRIWAQNGVLYGRIERTSDPADAMKTCEKCRDDRKGKPILGLDIIRGMKPDDGMWDGGEILDPENGQTYHCSMRLEAGGSKLVVRGYIGFSWLGRSQTWQRAG